MAENNTNNNHDSHVNVTVNIGDIKVQFNGSAESVLNSVITFLTKQVPAIDLAKKISLNYAVTDLIDTYSN